MGTSPKMEKMTDEEYRAVVIRIGTAFKELPDLRSQIDVLASLIGLLKDRPKHGLARGWLDEVEGILRGTLMVVKNDDEGGEKI
jgi:hypothetical protein